MDDVRDGVDIGLVAGESLGRLAAADIPELRGRVACAGNEDILVGAKRETGRCVSTERASVAIIHQSLRTSSHHQYGR